MKTLALILVLFLSVPVQLQANVILKREQFDAIDIIDKEMRNNERDYRGHSGSFDKGIEVFGITEDQFKKKLAKIDLETLKKNDPKKLRKDRLILKFKDIGFDDEMLEQIGLKVGK